MGLGWPAARAWQRPHPRYILPRIPIPAPLGCGRIMSRGAVVVLLVDWFDAQELKTIAQISRNNVFIDLHSDQKRARKAILNLPFLQNDWLL
jgi:hypothetical protein